MSEAQTSPDLHRRRPTLTVGGRAGPPLKAQHSGTDSLDRREAEIVYGGEASGPLWSPLRHLPSFDITGREGGQTGPHLIR